MKFDHGDIIRCQEWERRRSSWCPDKRAAREHRCLFLVVEGGLVPLTNRFPRCTVSKNYPYFENLNSFVRVEK
jgi:hypothetical protein